MAKRRPQKVESRPHDSHADAPARPPSRPAVRSPHKGVRNLVRQVVLVSGGIQEVRRLATSDTIDAGAIEGATQRRIGKSELRRPSVHVIRNLAEEAQSAPKSDPHRRKDRLIGAATARVLGDVEIGNLVRNIATRLTETRDPRQVNGYANDLRRLAESFLSQEAAQNLEPVLKEIADLKEPTKFGKMRTFFGGQSLSASRRNSLNSIVQGIGLVFEVAAYPTHAQPMKPVPWERSTKVTTEELIERAHSGKLFDPLQANLVDKDHLRFGIDHYGAYTLPNDFTFNPDTLADRPTVKETVKNQLSNLATVKTRLRDRASDAVQKIQQPGPLRADGTEMSLVEQHFTGPVAAVTTLAGAAAIAGVIATMPNAEQSQHPPEPNHKGTSVIAKAPAQNAAIQVNDGYAQTFKAIQALIGNAESKIIEVIQHDLRQQDGLKAYKEATALQDGPMKTDLLLALAPGAVDAANASGRPADGKYMDSALAHLAEQPGAKIAAENFRAQLSNQTQAQYLGS